MTDEEHTNKEKQPDNGVVLSVKPTKHQPISTGIDSSEGIYTGALSLASQSISNLQPVNS